MEPKSWRSATATAALSCTLILLAIASVPASAQAQERAWIRGEVRLNIRSGPGTQFRILGGVVTGDGMQVLERSESWTKVRIEDGTEGWIPAGYLSNEMPATLRLAEVEREVEKLREQLEITTSTGLDLKKKNEELVTSDEEQRTEIEQLTHDNIKLRAGARYPEMITGASILAAGMIIGSMLHRSATRRPQSRIRL